jgi:hypothetical protein
MLQHEVLEGTVGPQPFWLKPFGFECGAFGLRYLESCDFVFVEFM